MTRRLVSLLGRPLAELYARAATYRRERYATGRTPAQHLDHPVVSVGNLTLGGTGKTPMTILLATELERRGLKVSVLSRGYGGRRERDPMPVTESTNWREVGDEPWLIAREAQGARVTVGRRRYEAGRLAEESAVDLHLLDDGFQHLALARDLDVVMVDASVPLRHAYCPPSGPYREPPAALSEAQIVVVKTSHGEIPTDRGGEIDELKAPDATVHAARLVPEGLISSDFSETRPLSWLRERPVTVCSAIASPASFHETLTPLKPRLVATHAFPDHHPFRAAEVRTLLAEAETQQAEAVITTTKDAVRLREHWPSSVLPLYALRCRLEVERLDDILARIVSLLTRDEA